MEYARFPLREALSEAAHLDLMRILDNLEGVSHALREGAWIAGGFARQLLLDRAARAYFKPLGPSHIPSGDIDVFFNSVADAQRLIPTAACRSQAGFAKEVYETVKIQFVDDPGLIKPTIEETLSSFDIVNCRVAINHEWVIIPEGWRELEASKLLRIGRNDTPFLGSRLLKYLEHRGLEGITDDSYEQLTGWLAHAANDFKEGGWSPMHISGAQGHVKRLRDRGLVKREDLIFFIGKWKKIIVERSYASTVTQSVDWALHELESSVA